MTKNHVIINAVPRVHIALADLGHFTSRAYGGVGFAFDGPRNAWELRKAASTSFAGVERVDAAARDDFARLAASIVKLHPGVGFEARLISAAPQHAGFGTKTSLLLGLATGVYRLFDLSISPDALRRLCGRGGASGTGSHTFFEGGVVWDAGHPRDPTRPLGPSSAGQPANPPPKVARWPFPDSWRIATFLPPDAQFSGAAEREFFNENTPLPPNEVASTLSALYHAVAPAFATADLDLLRDGLHTLHTIGFKARALQRRPVRTRAFIDHVSESLSLPVGVSSIGPMIYVVLPANDGGSESAVRQAGTDFDIPYGGSYEGWNRGFELTHD